MTDIFKDEQIVAYFAGDDPQDFDTYDEAKEVVLENVESLISKYDELVKVKKVNIKVDGTIKVLSGKLTHDELVNLEAGTYICYPVYKDSGEAVICNTKEQVEVLIDMNKLERLTGNTCYVVKETITIHDQTNDEGFVPVKMEIHEGEDYIGELTNPMSSDFVNNGVGPNLTTITDKKYFKVYG